MLLANQRKCEGDLCHVCEKVFEESDPVELIQVVVESLSDQKEKKSGNSFSAIVVQVHLKCCKEMVLITKLD